jgi:3-oxoadipate enol-lactonase
LVCLHSLATDRSVFDAVAPSLGRSHRVLRVDLRGHGRSPATPAPYTLAELADDVVETLDHIGIERAHFLGLSVGGMVAMTLALDHPDRVDRLIVADARADAPLPYKKLWDDSIRRLDDDGIGPVVDASLDRWFRLAPDTARARVRAVAMNTKPAGFVGTARAVQQVDLLPRLGQITAPTLFVTGEHDVAAPPDVMQAMADAVPGARLVVIPGAAHLTPVEAPSAFTAAVTAFLPQPIG